MTLWLCAALTAYALLNALALAAIILPYPRPRGRE